MRPEHDARRTLILEWMSLPRERRQTEEQAAAFATQAAAKHTFTSGCDRAPSGSWPRPTAGGRGAWIWAGSMRPLRRSTLLGLRARGVGRRRKRAATAARALVQCVPGAREPTNVGLSVVEVVRTEII